MTDDRTAHWDDRYAGAEPGRLSWFEAVPERSLTLIRAAVTPRAAVIDVGGGASRLPDALLAAGFRDLTVLDLSAEALARSEARLGPLGEHVDWQVGDVTRWRPARRYDLWHDRALFHFLTENAHRAAYLDRLACAVKPGGTAIIMTFAEDGPETCSGLPVRRYSPEALAQEFSALAPGAFRSEEVGRFTHVTPAGAEQRFQYSCFSRI
ncbi:MAG: SAM-dependent methyltransferase [Rhodobacteraceae bacterium CG17_big_fil_post_rev_8_21_14_2_50_65_11]|nr:MAG: SAM-dependent methyltransferase [Rhodobacteraceae bacterium CG17_big_fil_post_rev_8_21_14_2_50_65_11]